ncbi:MAG: hypothetical protein ACREVI_04450 [Steroidobacteraceae bacterium]
MRLIAGSGRSGTTWVLDCLADANGLRPVFEPLHPARSAVGSRYAYRLIEPGEAHPDLEAYLSEVQRRTYRSSWTTYRSPRDRLFPPVSRLFSFRELKRTQYRWRRLLPSVWTHYQASRREESLIKCIRANLALGWLVKSVGASAIVIVRHPCAVVESQHRLGTRGSVWDPWPILERFRADRKFNERTGGVYLGLMRANLSKLEALTLLWVIENQWVVDRAAEYGYCLVHYEDLLSEPDIQWPRICEALALKNVPSQARLQRPSQQSSSKAADRATTPEAKWVGRLDAGQLAEVQGILDQAGFRLYEVGNTRPVMKVHNRMNPGRA